MRRRLPIENFECGLASVAVGAGDAMKFCVIDIGGGLQRAEDHCPANLQCTRIALGKRSAGKIEGRDWKLLACQVAQVIGQQPNFLQLRRSSSDRFTHIR